MESVLCFLLAFFVNLGFTFGSDIYPSIHWVPQNPIFQADGNICGRGPRRLKVQLNSKISFICPNLATVLQQSPTAVQTSEMYENLWLLQNKTAFDACDVSLDPTTRRMLTCNSPVDLVFSSVIFAEFTAEPNGLEFQGGSTYYFIATSDGTQSHINSISGGHCMDVNNNISMKIEVYVCEKGNQDPECASDVGNLICPGVTITTPSSSIAAEPTVTSITMFPMEELSTTEALQQSTIATASLNFCVQSVITKTVFSEVTRSVSYADACLDQKTTTSEDPCMQCISPYPTETTSVSVISTDQNSEAGLSTQEPLSESKEKSDNNDLGNKTSFPAIMQTTTMTTTETTTKTVAPTVRPTVTPSSATIVSSNDSAITTEHTSCATTFTKYVFSTVTFTYPCKRCISPLSTETTSVSPVTSTDQNSEAGFSGQEQLSDGKEEANNNGDWRTAAIFFAVLVSLVVVVVAVTMFLKYRNSWFGNSSRRVAPHEETSNETEVDRSQGSNTAMVT